MMTGGTELPTTEKPSTIVVPVPDIARWKMDEGTGTTTADSTGNGHTASFVGSGTAWTTGPNGNGALSFDSSGNLNVASSAAFDFATAPFSVSAWVNTTINAPSNFYRIISHEPSGQGWALWFDNANLLFTRANGSGTDYCASGNILVPSIWYHICGTFDGSTMNLYLNGANVATAGSTRTITTTSALTMACSSGGGNYFNGTLDDNCVFSFNLSAAQVLALYNAGAQ